MLIHILHAYFRFKINFFKLPDTLMLEQLLWIQHKGQMQKRKKQRSIRRSYFWAQKRSDLSLGQPSGTYFTIPCLKWTCLLGSKWSTWTGAAPSVDSCLCSITAPFCIPKTASLVTWTLENTRNPSCHSLSIVDWHWWISDKDGGLWLRLQDKRRGWLAWNLQPEKESLLKGTKALTQKAR